MIRTIIRTFGCGLHKVFGCHCLAHWFGATIDGTTTTVARSTAKGIIKWCFRCVNVCACLCEIQANKENSSVVPFTYMNLFSFVYWYNNTPQYLKLMTNATLYYLCCLIFSRNSIGFAPFVQSHFLFFASSERHFPCTLYLPAKTFLCDDTKWIMT